MVIDLQNIAKLRMAVARFGEMDRLRWWNTKGLLSNVGELAIARGLPKTHVFARARAAFAVASSRSQEVFNPPDSFTLWRLPVEIEDQLDDAWAEWLENPDEWKTFLGHVNQESGNDLLQILARLELLSDQSVERANSFRRADDLRSVPVKLNGESSMQAIELLAAAYDCSELGKISVPFIRQEDFPR